MKNLFCLSEEAISVLKSPGIKWKIMNALDINDSRTIDKHIKNNFPNSPLLNFNVREIMKNEVPDVNEKDLCHLLEPSKQGVIHRQNIRRHNK